MHTVLVSISGGHARSTRVMHCASCVRRRAFIAGSIGSSMLMGWRLADWRCRQRRQSRPAPNGDRPVCQMMRCTRGAGGPSPRDRAATHGALLARGSLLLGLRCCVGRCCVGRCCIRRCCICRCCICRCCICRCCICRCCICRCCICRCCICRCCVGRCCVGRCCVGRCCVGRCFSGRRLRRGGVGLRFRLRLLRCALCCLRAALVARTTRLQPARTRRVVVRHAPGFVTLQIDPHRVFDEARPVTIAAAPRGHRLAQFGFSQTDGLRLAGEIVPDADLQRHFRCRILRERAWEAALQFADRDNDRIDRGRRLRRSGLGTGRRFGRGTRFGPTSRPVAGLRLRAGIRLRSRSLRIALLLGLGCELRPQFGKLFKTHKFNPPGI